MQWLLPLSPNLPRTALMSILPRSLYGEYYGNKLLQEAALAKQQKADSALYTDEGPHLPMETGASAVRLRARAQLTHSTPD